MRVKYEKLREAARKARADVLLAEGGARSAPTVRKRPREDDKAEALYWVAIERIKKYRPVRNEKGRLVLPYFGLGK